MMIYSDENVTIFQSSLQETNSTVICSDDAVIITDPTWLPSEVEEIQKYVNKILGDRKLYLLFTHSDFDHIIGYKAFPEAKVIASRVFANSSSDKREKILKEIKSFDDEYYLTRDYDIAFPKVDYAFEDDGEFLNIGELRLNFYKAPGHNDDGMFTVIDPLGIFLPGDYFCEVEFPYIYYSGKLYENTLYKFDTLMEQFELKIMIPGHGKFTTDRDEMKHRQNDSLGYLNSMKRLIRIKDQEAVDRLISSYKFPGFMKKMNWANMELLKKEHSCIHENGLK